MVSKRGKGMKRGEQNNIMGGEKIGIENYKPVFLKGVYILEKK